MKKSCFQSIGTKMKFKNKIISIEYKAKKIVHNNDKYDAEIIFGAKINIINGFNIPPVNKSKAAN